MHKKLNILFLPKWYPSRVHRQNGDFIRRHALTVALKHRVAVLFVSADPTMKDKMYEAEFEMDAGITTVKVFYNNSFPDLPFVSPCIKFFRYLKSCRIGIKTINEKFGTPDICHIHVLSRTFLPSYYYKYYYKIPLVISEQWSGYLPENGAYKGFLKKRLTKIAVRSASAVTTVSESLHSAMLAHKLKNNYFIIPNVVDTQLFFPALQSKKKDKFILLHASNLVDRAKNISGMIRAIKKITEIRGDFEFQIAGEGADREKLEALAQQLNLLGRNVSFLGIKTSSEMAEMMRNADLFLLFSNYDNMPCVMVESFASGLPVIGAATHGIKEHVKEGRGILVAPGDENALCQAVLHAMNHISMYDKIKLHTYAKDNFSYEAASAQFDRIYQKLIQN